MALSVACFALAWNVGAGPAARWLEVESWTGVFRIEHIRNTVSGSLIFDKKVEPDTWAGSGSAIWSVDERQKVCSSGPLPCRDTTVRGSGVVTLGEGTELSVYVYEGTCDPAIYPGGERLEGMEVESTETPLGGMRLQNDPEAGMPKPTAEPMVGRGPFYNSSLHAEGLLGYLEEEIELPDEGSLLCGSQERADGMVIRGKFWPSDRSEPPCDAVDEALESRYREVSISPRVRL